MVYQQECTKRLIIGIIRSLRVTPIACALEAPKRHHKKTAFFIHLLLSYSAICINNKDLLKHGYFNFYAHISCKKRLE